MNNFAVRRMARLFIALGFLCATAALVEGQQPIAYANMVNSKGESVGKATFRTYNGDVVILLDLAQLPAGMHGIHIDSVGKCDAPDFTSAGDDFNPLGAQHGTQNPKGPHAGDLRNIEVGQDGKAHTSITAVDVTLADAANSLFHRGGTALVIYAQPDDYKTDPAGKTGARIACGVIQQ